MQIVINDNGILTAYAKIGKLKNGVDFFGDFPADFVPNKYKWQVVEPVISEDGEEEAVPCCIIRKERIEEKSTDEYGEEITVERIDSITEYGEIILNPDYALAEPAPVPPAPPTNAELAAAIAELAEVICGG